MCKTSGWHSLKVWPKCPSEYLSAGTDAEALSTAQPSLAPLKAWAFWRTTTETHFTATCDSAAYRSSLSYLWPSPPFCSLITCHTTSSKTHYANHSSGSPFNDTDSVVSFKIHYTNNRSYTV